MNHDQPATALPTPEPHTDVLPCEQTTEHAKHFYAYDGERQALCLGIVTPPLAREAPPHRICSDDAPWCECFIRGANREKAAREAETLTDRNEEGELPTAPFLTLNTKTMTTFDGATDTPMNEEGERRPTASVGASRTAGDEDALTAYDVRGLVSFITAERNERDLRHDSGRERNLIAWLSSMRTKLVAFGKTLPPTRCGICGALVIDGEHEGECNFTKIVPLDDAGGKP
jgi:hypothetical protein